VNRCLRQAWAELASGGRWPEAVLVPWCALADDPIATITGTVKDKLSGQSNVTYMRDW